MDRMSADEVRKLVDHSDWGQLKQRLHRWSPPAPEVADLILSLEKSDRVVVFRLLPRDISSEVFAYLDSEDQDHLIRDLTDEETRQLLAGMRPDDRTALLGELPGQLTQKLLNLLSPDDLREARQLLGYPEESIGRLMTPEYVAVRSGWTVARALDHIREKGRDSETVNVIYVVDDRWKLMDSVELRKLILADARDTVEQLMDHSFVSLLATDDRETAVATMKRYDINTLPVVDSDGILVGIVTADDVLDVAEEEATEDFHKHAAVAPLRTGYGTTTAWELFSRRVGWLVLLIFLNLVSSSVIAAFEETLASALALAFFIPLLMDSGGNAGYQSSALIVRALAVGDLRLGQWAKALGREVIVGLSLGVVMGVVSGLLGAFRGGYEIGLVVGATMVSIILMANILGISLPLILVRLKLDPAIASGPLITSMIDASGLLIYFLIASRMLGL
ncbi:MAG: magnesium transporter [Firmicutes bacterium]|nr:magnesium transporter [Bacillota bacterium]